MRVSDFRYNFSLRLLYVGFYRVEKWWNYQDIISPFSRLFLITKGEATVLMNGQEYTLTAGELFLIPSFVLHSYRCENYMEHYYICFFHEALGISDFSEFFANEGPIPAKEDDYTLAKRLANLNKEKQLPAVDPKKYDNKQNNLIGNEFWPSQFTTEIESNGILLQLFSRLLASPSQLSSVKNNSSGKFNQIINHIHNNLRQRISVTDLATIMCCTPDHFSRTFKKILGVSPCEYIQLKRIERAQNYLQTSQFTIKEIAEMVGIPNLSQFSRLFSTYNHISPRKYRIIYQEKKPID